MKVTIIRKVNFKDLVDRHTGEPINKSESIINQYVLEGTYEEVESMINHCLEYLRPEFTQEKEKKK